MSFVFKSFLFKRFQWNFGEFSVLLRNLKINCVTKTSLSKRHVWGIQVIWITRTRWCRAFDFLSAKFKLFVKHIWKSLRLRLKCASWNGIHWWKPQVSKEIKEKCFSRAKNMFLCCVQRFIDFKWTLRFQ